MQNIVSRLARHLALVALLCIFALTQVFALFQPNHSLKNLEPYPDSLLYALGARNLAATGTLGLTYRDSTLPHWVPPLYTLVLSLGYAVSSYPPVFVLTNTLLALATIIALYWGTLHTTNSKTAAILVVFAYLAHAWVWWLPSLALSENLSLFLFTLGAISLTALKTKPLTRLLIVGAVAVALVFTRYASVTIAATLVALSLLPHLKSRSKQQLFLVAALLAVAGAGFGLLVTNPLALGLSFINRLLAPDDPYFSLGFFLPNLGTFAGALLGNNASFLWQSLPFTSIFLSIWLALLGILANHFNKLQSQAKTLLILFLAQLPLQLVFYVADTRYLIYSLPLIALATGWSFALLSRRVVRRVLLPFFLCLIGLHTLTQHALFKEVLASNFFGTSAAWQVEAVAHFDQFFKQKRAEDIESNIEATSTNQPAYLITALPPFLVDAYSAADATNYRLLPLSTHQEFAAKDEWVWGSNPTSKHWPALPQEKKNQTLTPELFHLLYDQLLLEGERLYISNAYITHLSSVVADYETLKGRYLFAPVSTGCEGACDLFVLQQRQ